MQEVGQLYFLVILIGFDFAMCRSDKTSCSYFKQRNNKRSKNLFSYLKYHKQR